MYPTFGPVELLPLDECSIPTVANRSSPARTERARSAHLERQSIVVAPIRALPRLPRRLPFRLTSKVVPFRISLQSGEGALLHASC